VPDENPSGLGAFEFPLRYPGQYFDKETNLHFNYFRDYDPAIGRYTQSDPIGLRGGLNTADSIANRVRRRASRRLRGVSPRAVPGPGAANGPLAGARFAAGTQPTSTRINHPPAEPIRLA
jgi:RHS repeat-associated protein